MGKNLPITEKLKLQVILETLWLRVAKNTGFTEKLSFKSIPQNSCATNI